MSKTSEALESRIKAFEFPDEDDFFSGCPIPGSRSLTFLGRVFSEHMKRVHSRKTRFQCEHIFINCKFPIYKGTSEVSERARELSE